MPNDMVLMANDIPNDMVFFESTSRSTVLLFFIFFISVRFEVTVVIASFLREFGFIVKQEEKVQL
jgi:hypothetical protein